MTNLKSDAARHIDSFLDDTRQDPALWVERHVDLGHPQSVSIHCITALELGVQPLVEALCPYITDDFIEPVLRAAATQDNVYVFDQLCRHFTSATNPAQLLHILCMAFARDHHAVTEWLMAGPQSAELRKEFVARAVFLQVCSICGPEMVEHLLPWHDPNQFQLADEPLFNAMTQKDPLVLQVLLDHGMTPQNPSAMLHEVFRAASPAAETLWKNIDPVAAILGGSAQQKISMVNAAIKLNLISTDQMDAILAAAADCVEVADVTDASPDRANTAKASSSTHTKDRWIEECPELSARNQKNRLSRAVDPSAASFRPTHKM